MDLSAFLDEFRAEADEHLAALDAQLLRLEREPNTVDSIRTMFLSAHTIKGGASMLGLLDVAQLAHALEDLLGHYRDSRKPLERSTADLLFRTLDELRARVADSTPGKASPSVLVAELAAALQRLTGSPAGSNEPKSERRLSRPAHRRALIVHASATVRLVQQLQLEAAGFAVEALESTSQAAASTGRYALIVIGQSSTSLNWDCELEKLLDPTADSAVPFILTGPNPAEGTNRREGGALRRCYVQIGPREDSGLADAARAALPSPKRRLRSLNTA